MTIGKHVKEEAKRLITKEGRFQKEVSKMLGVSEKTLSQWVTKYGWRKDINSELYDIENPMLSYLKFLKNEYPDTYQIIQKTFLHFQKQQQDASNKI